MTWKYNITLHYTDGTKERFSIEGQKEQASIEEARERADKEVDYVGDTTYVE